VKLREIRVAGHHCGGSKPNAQDGGIALICNSADKHTAQAEETSLRQRFHNLASKILGSREARFPNQGSYELAALLGVLLELFKPFDPLRDLVVVEGADISARFLAVFNFSVLVPVPSPSPLVGDESPCHIELRGEGRIKRALGEFAVERLKIKQDFHVLLPS